MAITYEQLLKIREEEAKKDSCMYYDNKNRTLLTVNNKLSQMLDEVGYTNKEKHIMIVVDNEYEVEIKLSKLR